MKTMRRAGWCWLVGLTCTVGGWATPASVQTKPKPPVPVPTAPAAAEEATVKGVEAKRDGEGFLGLAVEGNAFVLRFYDADKHEIPANAARAMARWDSPVKLGKQRTVLNPAGAALQSPPVVRPPLSFTAFITLLAESGEVIESKMFNLRTLP